MAGRPRKNIDKTNFEKLCAMMCTQIEICGFFSCSEDTLLSWCKRTYNKTFEDIYPLLSSNGRISLRRIQFQLAEKNAAMAIFLGKQYLGQKDNPSTEEDAETLEKLKEIINNVKLDAKKVDLDDVEDKEDE